jgi:hypothetical protein
VQSIKNLILILIFTSLVTACSDSSGGGGAFEIGEVDTQISHTHASFYEQLDDSPSRTIEFSVSFAMSLSEEPGYLRKLFVRDKSTGRFWSVLDSQSGQLEDECSVSEGTTYACTFYSNADLDRVSLKQWEVVAENKEAEVISKGFEFLLPGGETVEAERFVYSSTYADSTSNGIAALEAMSILENELAFTADSGAQSFTIQFSSKDARAKNYAFAFDNITDGTLNSIGLAAYDSPSIASMPLVVGDRRDDADENDFSEFSYENQVISISIPWSEITLIGSATIGTINGVHIHLFDEPASSQSSELWFNYSSISEYLELSPSSE